MSLYNLIPTVWLLIGVLGAVSGLVVTLSKVRIPVFNGEFDLGAVMLFASLVMVLLGVVFLPGEKT